MRFLARKKIILAGIIFILFILSLNFFQKEVKGFFYSISWPIQKTLWGAGGKVSNFFGSIFEAKELKKQKEELNLKLQEQLAENISLQELKKENQVLREALDLGLQKDFRLELAEIIGKDINQESIIINKGSKDGVSKDLAVITSQKVLLGKTTEVYDNFSRVILISDKESSFEAKVLVSPDEAGGAESGISGIIKGQGAFGAKMTLIPKEKELREGDLAVSGGLNMVYPKNLLVGLVKKVEKSDVSPFQEAEISLLFDFSNLEEVFVVLDF